MTYNLQKYCCYFYINLTMKVAECLSHLKYHFLFYQILNNKCVLKNVRLKDQHDEQIKCQENKSVYLIQFDVLLTLLSLSQLLI